MKYVLIRLSLTVLCFITIPQISYSQRLSKLDVRWKIMNESDSLIFLQLQLRSWKESENIGNANIVFNYDDKVLGFANNKTEGATNKDCYWSQGFEPSDTSQNAFCTVTRPVYGQLSININLEPGFAVPITTDTTYTPVITLKFKKLKPEFQTSLTFKMDMMKPPLFDNIFDEKLDRKSVV